MAFFFYSPDSTANVVTPSVMKFDVDIHLGPKVVGSFSHVYQVVTTAQELATHIGTYHMCQHLSFIMLCVMG